MDWKRDRNGMRHNNVQVKKNLEVKMTIMDSPFLNSLFLFQECRIKILVWWNRQLDGCRSRDLVPHTWHLPSHYGSQRSQWSHNLSHTQHDVDEMKRIKEYLPLFLMTGGFFYIMVYFQILENEGRYVFNTQSEHLL